MRLWAFYIVSSCLLISACSSKADFQSVSLMGHGGNGIDRTSSIYHDNTLESIELALGTPNCDGVELDVQYSVDGTAWLFHDLESVLLEDYDYSLNNATDEQLSTIRYPGLTKTHLMKLDQLPLESVMNRTVILDIKNFNASTNQAVPASISWNAIKDMILINPQTNWIVETNSRDLLDSLITNNVRAILHVKSVGEANEALLEDPELYGFVINNSDVTQSDVSEIQANGSEVYIFEVRSAQGNRSAMRKLPNGIITDDLVSASQIKN